MALTNTALPYGIRDLKVTPINADGTLGTGVDLPNIRSLAFTEAEDFEELRGDDSLVAVRGNGPVVEWEMEAGGISFDAYKVLAGGTVTVTGVTPNQIRTHNKKGTDARPYFQIEGQAISDSGGDIHVVIFKAKVTDNLEGTFEEGTFWMTGASGQALPRASDNALYEFRQHESQTAIA